MKALRINAVQVEAFAVLLQEKLSEGILEDIYSRNKQNVEVVFKTNENFFVISILFKSSGCFIITKEINFHKRPSSVYVFAESLFQRKVNHVSIQKNDRKLAITFDEDCKLLFHFFGSLFNLIAIQTNTQIACLRQEIKNDTAIHSIEGFVEPTFSTNFAIEINNQSHEIVPDENGESIDKCWNICSQKFLKEERFILEKSAILKKLKDKLSHNQKQQTSNAIHLNQLINGPDHSKIGDNLLAQKDQIHIDGSKLKLLDLYTGDILEIKVNPSLTITENAALFYKTAKNKKTEIVRCQEKIIIFEKSEKSLKEQIDRVEKSQKIEDFNQKNEENSSEENIRKPYRLISYKGWQILIGKSAKENDQLTFKISHKLDLWLHAANVSGSHVIIRQRKNEVFPYMIIEKAAELAAYYSKSSSSEWVSVIYGLRKFVSKPRGAAPGAVNMSTYEEILVNPNRNV